MIEEDNLYFLGDYISAMSEDEGESGEREEECGVKKKHLGRKRWRGNCTDGVSQSWRMRTENSVMEI